MYKNALEYLENAAKIWPDRTAFADDREAFTYSELHDVTRRIGTGLTAYVEPRQPVAVVVTDRSVRCVASMLGVLYAGCPYCPLDANIPAQRMRVVFDLLKPSAVIVDSATRANVEEMGYPCHILNYEDLVQTAIDEEKMAAIRFQASPWDILSILFTSGSTGIPKGVAQSHYSYVSYIEVNTKRFGFRLEDEVVANQSPFFYANSITDIYPAMKIGSPVYIMSEKCLSFPKMLVDTLREKKVTELTMTPSSYVKAAQSGVLTEGCLPDLLYIVLSGEAAHWQTLQVWLKAAPNAKVWNFYGSTEMLGVAVRPLMRVYGDDEVIPVGTVHNGVEVLIVDEDGQPVPQGEKGEMYISSPWLFSGYYRDYELTEAAFDFDPLERGYRTRYYRTGDIGSFTEDGELRVHGRKDNQIKRAGYRMEIGEVEAALRVIPGWEHGVVLYEKESQKLACFWTGPLTKKEIMAELKKTLPRYAQPDTYIHLDEMPYTSTMKIDRVTLKKMI